MDNGSVENKTHSKPSIENDPRTQSGRDQSSSGSQKAGKKSGKGSKKGRGRRLLF